MVVQRPCFLFASQLATITQHIWETSWFDFCCWLEYFFACLIRWFFSVCFCDLWVVSSSMLTPPCRRETTWYPPALRRKCWVWPAADLVPYFLLYSQWKYHYETRRPSWTSSFVEVQSQKADDEEGFGEFGSEQASQADGNVDVEDEERQCKTHTCHVNGDV